MRWVPVMQKLREKVDVEPQVLAALCAHATAAFPNECLGVLLEDDRGCLVAAAPVENAAADPRLGARLRGRDLEHLRACAGQHVGGFYHSHPNGAAVPSAADRLAMRAGELLVLAAIDRNGVVRLRAWRASREARFLYEVALPES